MAPIAGAPRGKLGGLGAIQHLWRGQRGASLIDYAILAALITALITARIALSGSWVQSM
jgi:Flp pilus assembly pilin Flp